MNGVAPGHIYLRPFIYTWFWGEAYVVTTAFAQGLGEAADLPCGHETRGGNLTEK